MRSPSTRGGAAVALPAEIQRVLQEATAVDGLNSADAAREAARKAERERVERWYERFLQRAPIRGTERAWRPKDTHSVRAVRQWLRANAKARKRGADMHLMLRGGVGAGKSTAAACAVKYWTEYPEERGSCVWLKPDQLVSALHHAYDPTSPQLARWIVLDDIGRETKPGFEEALTEMLEKRGHTLLMTTNLTYEEMRDRYDRRVMDRLRDTTTAVDVPEESMRQGEGWG